jgi:hypothetical protein
VIKTIRHRLQNQNGLFGHFRSDPVARYNREF